MGKEVLPRSRAAGLIIDGTKLKFMSNKGRELLKLGGVVIEWVEEVEHLGQMISFRNRRGQE